MPLYEYRCLDCSELQEEYRSVADRDKTPDCNICGGITKKIISGYRVHGDFDPYYDENLETYVRSKQHRKHVMKAQGLEEHYGQNWHTSAKKTRKVG